MTWNPFSQETYEGATFLQRVGMGLEKGYSYVEKFGENPDVDTSTTPEYIWSYGGVMTWSTTADITQVSSSDISDTAEITIQGLDENWQEVTQTVTLNGQLVVSLSTPLIRAYRGFNSNGTLLVGDMYLTTTGAVLSSGVPTVASTVRMKITADAQQSEMCIYTIPAGKTGYFYGGYVALSRTGNNEAVFTSRVRADGGVFRVVSRISAIGTGSSNWQYQYPIPIELPAKTDVILQCDDVGANNTGVSGGFTILLKED